MRNPTSVRQQNAEAYLPVTARAKEFGYAEHAFRCLESAKAYATAHIKHS